VDSGIRVTVSKIAKLQYGAGQYMHEFSAVDFPDASYVIPQTEGVIMTYVGTLGTDMWVSVVADSINGGNPCIRGSDAAANADVYHSGAIQPTGAYAGTKTISIPQTQALLDVDTQFAVCYAEGDGSTSDTTWHDSYIRMKVSKLYQIVSKRVPHYTWGQIDSMPNLNVTLAGGLLSNSTAALVEASLNSGFPCAPSEAASPADALHSGPSQGSNSHAILDTSAMSTTVEYAVCYAEGSGSALDTSWRDSGIRVTLSPVDRILYGYPQRWFDSTTIGIDRLLPRGKDVAFSYTGTLPSGSFSLVNENIESYNPCMTASEAAHTPDAHHSGVSHSVFVNGETLITISTDVLAKGGLYALCYAQNGGSDIDPSWRDSYLRIPLQQVKSLKSSGIEVTTSGTFPYAEKLEVVYEGGLPVSMWMSFVVQTLNNGNPCDPAVATAATDSNHSGVFRAGDGVKIIYPFTTTGLTANAQFAVCYAEVSGDASDTWIDTGLRLRFFGWVNTLQNRFVSGASSALTFTLNQGVSTGDILAILPEDGTTTCNDAPNALFTSDGTKVLLTVNSAASVHLAFLNNGYYFMCMCHLNGVGGSRCQNSNGAFAYFGASFKVINVPLLGDIMSPGDLRAVTGSSHTYQIKGSSETAFAVGNSDKIFFRSDCSNIPINNSASETKPLDISGYVSATKSAYFTLPLTNNGPLEASGAVPRVLQACFSTSEATSSAGGAVANDYITLGEVLAVSPVPRLGPLSNPGSIRAVSSSNATFTLHNYAHGDSFFFGTSCASIPEFTNTTSGLLNATLDSATSSGSFSLPQSPFIVALETEETRQLKCCFAPAQVDIMNPANWYELTDTLDIIPEPVTSLVATWKERNVDVLDFSGPDGHAALKNDIVVLQKETCDNAHLLTAVGPQLGLTHSAPMSLETGGVASTFAIAQGKVNELRMGTYKICFATASSEYDASSDFKMLDVELVLTESVVISPSLIVPDSILLGVDVVVVWNATDGQYSSVSQPGSWLGLYKKGECSAESEWQHKCYLVAHELPAGESGGVVRFTQSDYKSAGEYEVRYFRGNTRSGQGQVCSGLRDTGSGTYIQCSLLAAATSETISVFGSVESEDDMSSVPGLEHVVLV